MTRPAILLLMAMAIVPAAHAQQAPSQQPPSQQMPVQQVPAGSAPSAKTCAYQYKDAVGVTPAQLLGRGFEIKTGWPGGLWLQKDKTAYFCNSGRTAEGAVICWTMVEPVSGAACQ